MPKQPQKAPRPRRRRSPEEAQTEILDAAERLIAAQGPDAVGLKAVAAEAQVSHGLVTHYFGTYDALVAAVLKRRTSVVRDEALKLLADPAWSPAQTPLVDVLFKLLRDPVQVRLMAWAILSGRAEQLGLLQTLSALRQVADELGQFILRTHLGGSAPPGTQAALPPELQREIEFGLVVGVCASFGFALGGQDLLRALGRPTGPEAEADFRERLRVTLAGRFFQVVQT